MNTEIYLQHELELFASLFALRVIYITACILQPYLPATCSPDSFPGPTGPVGFTGAAGVPGAVGVPGEVVSGVAVSLLRPPWKKRYIK